MDSSKIRAAVFQALNNAHENDEFTPGGNLHQLTAEQVADDLAAFDADLDQFAPLEIQPYVVDWMNVHRSLERA